MVNIAIIGYGGMGSYHHTRLKSIKNINVVGALDIDKDVQGKIVENGLTAYKTKDDVVKSGVNAVLIATPNDVHLEYVEYFSKNKINIICEKPATMTVEDFTKMQVIAQKNNVVFTVNQNRRLDADYLTVFEIIKSKVLGKVYRVDSCVFGANGIPGGWRKIEEKGGGMMLDWGVHLLDQIYHQGFISPKKLSCYYSYILGFKVEDGFSLTMNFDSSLAQKEFFTDSVQFNVEVNTNSFVEIPRWVVYGENGTLMIDDFCNGGRIVLAKETDEKLLAVQYGNGLTKTMASRPESGKKEIKVKNIESDGDYLYNNFINAIENNAEIFVKTNEVCDVIAIMQKCKQSAMKR